MATKYYKTSDEKVLSAIRKLNKEKDELIAKSNILAAKFNAKAMTSTSTTGARFAGIVLNNYHGFSWGRGSPIREDKILWTAPNSNNISWPRSSLTKKHFEPWVRGMDDVEKSDYIRDKRAQLKDLQSEYNSLSAGINSIRFDDFFESIGTDWGNMMFSGIKWLELDGIVYLATSQDLANVADEILGSEFEAAHTKNRDATK